MFYIDFPSFFSFLCKIKKPRGALYRLDQQSRRQCKAVIGYRARIIIM